MIYTYFMQSRSQVNRKHRTTLSSKLFASNEGLIELANLPDKGISQFRRKYGQGYSRYTDEDILSRRDELRLFWRYRLWEYPPERFEFWEDGDNEYRPSKEESRLAHLERRKAENEWYAEHPTAIRPHVPKRANKLYKNWSSRYDLEIEYGERNLTTLDKAICEHWLKLETMWWRVIWEKDRKIIGVHPKCLPATLAQVCLRARDSLGYCRNPRCSKPYFFLKKRHQLYCSPACAQPARRAAQLRYWHKKHGRISAASEQELMLLEGTERRRAKFKPLRPPLKRKN